jgi:hypothetical protein
MTTYSNFRFRSLNNFKIHTDSLGQSTTVRSLLLSSSTGEPLAACKQKRCPTNCVNDFDFFEVPLARCKTQKSNMLEAKKKEGKGKENIEA